jgi:hypothetical protein
MSANNVIWCNSTRKVGACKGEIMQPIGADAAEITACFRDPGGNVIGVYQHRG